MSLPVHFLDELRARTVLSQLIGRSVRLEKRGREMAGCCPFHSEKTPSFYVNDEKGFGHCFGCGAHVDAIDWLVRHDGLDFLDAVRQLAGEAGMAMPERSPAQAEKAARIDGIRPALKAAQALYARELESAGGPREYLAGRGIDDAAIERFGIGWAPARRGHLREAGVTLTVALAAGLAWRNEDRSGEQFHARIMLPVHDQRGRIVGFGGRAIAAGASAGVAKYKNSPDSEIFDKGRLLFNLHRAAPEARRTGTLVIAEGYFDVIALDHAGIPAVAPMGTALTPAQMERAWRQVQTPVLMFDGDAAGIAAARRACEAALPLIGPGRSLAVALLAEGRDPDDVLRGEGGADGDGAAVLAAFVAGAAPMSAFLFDALAGDCPQPRTPEAAAEVWSALSEMAARIGDDGLREQYIGLWRGRFDGEVSLSRALMPAAEPVHALRRADDGDYAFPEEVTESGEKLRMIVDALLDKRAARSVITEEIAALMAVAKALGFVPKEINAVARAIEADAAAREESEAVLVSYRRALGVRGPMVEAMLPAIGTERADRAARVMTKRLSRTMALIDAREVRP